MDERGTQTSWKNSAASPGLTLQISISDIVSNGRALQARIKQLWQEDMILTDGVINSKKMSWCILLSSGVFCLCLILLALSIGLSRAASTPCRASLTSDKTDLCPKKKGFLGGEPCGGECGGFEGCRTTDSSQCSKKCSKNPNCRAWTFNPSQNRCRLKGRYEITLHFSDSDVWGFACRSTECQDTLSVWGWGVQAIKASEFYRGKRSVTRSGKKCRNWSSVGRSLKHVGDHNYCRNPNSQWEGVGCFTEDGGKELCEVPACFDRHVSFSSNP